MQSRKLLGRSAGEAASRQRCSHAARERLLAGCDPGVAAMQWRTLSPRVASVRSQQGMALREMQLGVWFVPACSFTAPRPAPAPCGRCSAAAAPPRCCCCSFAGVLRGCRVKPELREPQALCMCPTRELVIQNQQVGVCEHAAVVGDMQQ